MLEYLWQYKPIENRECLVALMKKSPAKDKRYASLHLYTALFVSDYTKPTPPKNMVLKKKAIVRCFEEVEFAHRRHFPDNHPFFNYMWLLAKYLESFKMTQYLPYVKHLKCKHRRQVYENMFETIMHSGTCAPTSDDA